MIKKYRKLPGIVDAVQWNGTVTSFNEIQELNINNKEPISYVGPDKKILLIPVLGGKVSVLLLDWVIQGVNGEIYSCKPDIFKKTYEKVIEESVTSKIFTGPSNHQELITKVCDNLKTMLLEKNKRYGNSALEPINIYSYENSLTAIGVRIDDKLSRIRNSVCMRKNDTADLIGYLILLCIKMEWIEFEDLID